LAQLEITGNRLAVRGAMTVETVKALLAESAGVFAARDMEVDLAQVEEVDSSALGVMFEWLRQAHARDTSLTFVGLPAPLTSLATLYGVLDIIPHHSH